MTTSGRNIESELARFRKLHRADLRNHVDVNTTTPGVTHITVSHTLPHQPFGPGGDHWLITTAGHRLSASRFAHENSRDSVHDVRGKPRARAIFARRIVTGRAPRPRDMFAAASFHVDGNNDAPIVLRALATRTDVNRDVGQLFGGILLEYLIEIDRQLWSGLSKQQRSQASASEPRPRVVAEEGRLVIEDIALLDRYGMGTMPKPPRPTMKGTCRGISWPTWT